MRQIQSILKRFGERGIVLTKKHKFRKRLLYSYLSLVLSVFVFFTIYAFRYDMLDYLYHKGEVNLSISSEVIKKIQKEFSNYEIKNQNMDSLLSILSDEIPGCTFEIVYEKSEGNYAKMNNFFFVYGRAPYAENSKYITDIAFIQDGKEIVINCFPYFTDYLCNYRIVSLLIAVFIGVIFFLILNKGWIKAFFIMLYHKTFGKYSYKIVNKLSVKMALINIIAILIAFSIFMFTFINRYAFFEFMLDTFYQRENLDDYITTLRDEVKDLKMNKSNKEKVMNALLNRKGEHFEAYIYKEDGLYYVGGDVGKIASRFTHNAFDVYSVSAIDTPLIYTYPVPFKDQIGSVIIYSYPLLIWANSYQYIIFGIAFSFYLIIILYFLNMKIASIKLMQEDVSILANGDWKHDVHVSGNDEIAELGEHLNQMRISFVENMENEKVARNANKDLISAMSHDLRTPLTTLNGYLEIVQLEKGDKNKREEYIKRCLDKVAEIRDLSDKMFEYSLVFSSEDDCVLQKIEIREISQCLNDHIQYLKVLGFNMEASFHLCELSIDANWLMLQRIFNNLFSNIQKYADKEKMVHIDLIIEKSHLKLTLINFKNKHEKPIESNGIGLKSVRKMVAIHKGECYISNNEDDFMIVISLPIKTEEQ